MSGWGRGRWSWATVEERRQAAEEAKLHDKPEVEIQREILSALERVGIMCWRQLAGGGAVGNRAWVRRAPVRGLTDVLGIVPRWMHDANGNPIRVGQLLAIEVKRARGVMSLAQKAHLSALQREGALAFVAHSAEEALARVVPLLEREGA